MASKPDFKIGDIARIQVDLETFKRLQTDPEWVDFMRSGMGRIGTITNVYENSTEIVFGVGGKLRFNHGILAKVTPLKVGDRVRILDDEHKIRVAQEGHAGWSGGMANTMGQEGVVIKVFDNEDLRVSVAGKWWNYNINALTRLPDVEQDANVGQGKN